MAKKNRKKLGKFELPQLRNASKTLLANIRFASVDDKVKAIVVTSSGVDEGKTAVCTNLANAMASSGKRVLLIDADMRRRCIANIMDVHPKCGIYAVLSGNATLNEAIVPTRVQNLYFLDSEPKIPSPPDILSTKRFAALIDKVRDSFDYVVIDTPPVGAFVDAAIVSSLVDGTLFVIRQNATRRDDAAACIKQLRAANARILGTVITFSDDDSSDYYYAYYNEDGKRVDKEAPTVAPSADLAQGDIGSWARRAGIDPERAKRAGNAAASAPGRAHVRTGAASSGTAGAAAAAQAHRQSSRTAGTAGVDAANVPNVQGGNNPYPAGAFKPATPSKKPRHKNSGRL